MFSIWILAPGAECPNGDADCAAHPDGFTACSVTNTICVGRLHTFYKKETLVFLDKLYCVLIFL